MLYKVVSISEHHINLVLSWAICCLCQDNDYVSEQIFVRDT